jgi:hypothetical protein
MRRFQNGLETAYLRGFQGLKTCKFDMLLSEFCPSFEVGTKKIIQ